MSDYPVSVVRTVVPMVWGAVVAWLVARGLLPAEMAAEAEGFGGVLTVIAGACWYAAARWLERRSWFPAWLARLLLGSPQVPTYPGGAERSV